METIKKGSRGDAVKTLQNCLGLKADGIFGKCTEDAVKSFQEANKLVPDGIVSTKTWEKLLANANPQKTAQTSRKIKEVILHCSATPEGKDYSVSTIRQWHLQRGFSDIGYHYVISNDSKGTVNVGRSETIAGAHCTGHNSYSIGICYVGGLAKDGKTAKDTRTEVQKQSLYQLVDDIITKYGLSINDVHCHNEYANKACPCFKIGDFRKEFLEWKQSR